MLKDHPITSFEASIISSYYHLEDGERSLDEKLIKKFPHNPKELLKAWYKPTKYSSQDHQVSTPPTTQNAHINTQWPCYADYTGSPDAQRFRITLGAPSILCCRCQVNL
jgi:hypothetical protein